MRVGAARANSRAATKNNNERSGLFVYTGAERLRTMTSLARSPLEPQEEFMVDADEPTQPRRRQRKSRAPQPVVESAMADLEQAIEYERTQLSQIHAMLKCLYEVLLYADDSDSVMHADVANVAARLLSESVARLAMLRMRAAKPYEPAVDRASLPPHQVKEPTPVYLC
jgi:hypothetical protein